MSKVIGIDLGTTNCCVSIMDGKNSKVIENSYEFKKLADLIIANRMSDDVMDVMDKVYTRDFFNGN